MRDIKLGFKPKFVEPEHPRLYLDADKKKYTAQLLKEKFNLTHGNGIRKKKKRRKNK